MKRKYELVFLIPENVTISKSQEKIKSILKKHEAKILNESDMGHRQLAYTIFKNRQKFEKAFYYLINAEIDAANLQALESEFRIDEDIIRHMVLLEK